VAIPGGLCPARTVQPDCADRLQDAARQSPFMLCAVARCCPASGPIVLFLNAFRLVVDSQCPLKEPTRRGARADQAIMSGHPSNVLSQRLQQSSRGMRRNMATRSHPARVSMARGRTPWPRSLDDFSDALAKKLWMSVAKHRALLDDGDFIVFRRLTRRQAKIQRSRFSVRQSHQAVQRGLCWGSSNRKGLNLAPNMGKRQGALDQWCSCPTS